MANLTIKNLKKSFGETEILKGINLEIKDNEFVSPVSKHLEIELVKEAVKKAKGKTQKQKTRQSKGKAGFSEPSSG